MRVVRPQSLQHIPRPGKTRLSPKRAYLNPRKPCRRASFKLEDVAAFLANQLVSRSAVHANGNLVGHRAGGHEQTGLGPQKASCFLLEDIDRWILSEHIVADLGGEVVKFAGDALLAVWFADDLGGLQQAVAAAGECVLAIADSMERHASVDDVPLSLRVGLGAGPFSAARIGGVRGR